MKKTNKRRSLNQKNNMNKKQKKQKSKTKQNKTKRKYDGNLEPKTEYEKKKI